SPPRHVSTIACSRRCAPPVACRRSCAGMTARLPQARSGATSAAWSASRNDGKRRHRAPLRAGSRGGKVGLREEQQPEGTMKRLGLVVLAVLCVLGAAQAQEKYPSKPVKVMVPFGPGSATDIVIRIVGEQLRTILGQAVVIENKPGAFGIIAIEEMAHARPDGYTLQIGNPGTNVLTPIIYKKKFRIDYEKEVVMVNQLGEEALGLAVTTKDFTP